MGKDSPRIFISYSWDSEGHKAWVRKLAEQLTYQGVNVRLDLWHVAPGQSLTQFMEQELRAADFCIVVCTPNYARKADTRTGGVGYEQQIISGDLMSGIERLKFIPILRSGEYFHGPEHGIPTHFSGIASIDFRLEDTFESKLEELLRVIYAKPKYAPPERGQVVHLPAEQHSPPVYAKQAKQPKLSAEILEWVSLDTLRFTNDVFNLAESSEINADLLLEISAPDLTKLVTCIKSQSDRQKDQQIMLDQREAIQIALKRLEAAQKTGADLLSNISAYYGLRNAISSISQYLKLIMAFTVYHLARYQINDESAIFFDFKNWFESPHPAAVTQFVYSHPAVVAVIISSHKFPDSSDKYANVYLPLGCIENDGSGDLISLLWESCEHIPDKIWLDYVIPQMALVRTIGHSSYRVWTKDSSVYCTEGIIWRGSSHDQEFSETIGESLHTIVPRE